MSNSNLYCWNRQDSPAALNNALDKITKFFPQISSRNETGKKLIFKYNPDSTSTFMLNNNNEVTIEYNKLNLALRMVGNLLSGREENIRENTPFEMFGIMLDCSRNAVMLPQRMEKYFVRLALMGYNMIMLYTEDTYEIADEPFFGFMRGRLSMAEVRMMDDICFALGMEMIPCIQTLGHLEQIFHWPRFGAVKDTDRVMLVDSDATYELIEKMVATWKNNVRTNRIHVGMDETHDIGRGKFYDLHGDERHYDIFNRHLQKVSEICEKHGMKPMIWSDMYFRMGSRNNDYYDVNCVIPEDVAKQIPAKAELVYWDYYHDDKAFYLDWIERHRKLRHEPLMGSGVWTWNKFWYDKEITQRNVVPCIQACREAKVKEIFFTMWGDDGGFCDFNSAMAGLFFAAELGFTGTADEKVIKQKYAAILDKANYDHIMLASELEAAAPAYALWDDPLMMLFLGGAKLRTSPENQWYPEMLEYMARLTKKLNKVSTHHSDGGDLRFARLLAEAVESKMILVDNLLERYQSGKISVMEKSLDDLKDYAVKFDRFAKYYREWWMRNNKPFGFETLQIRFAGQSARIKELKVRLKALIAGKADNLPELDELIQSKGDFYVLNYLGISHGSKII